MRNQEAEFISKAMRRTRNPEVLGGSPWAAWTPTFGGFSADPAGVAARFCIIGDTLFFSVNIGTAGTSNATTYTMTFPVAPAVTGWGLIANTQDNSAATGPGRYLLTAGSTTVNLYPTATTTAWTASGTKRAIFSGFYEI